MIRHGTSCLECLATSRAIHPTRRLNWLTRCRDRGWSVLALDPRTFRQAKTLEEACGCDPKPRVQDSRLFYDVSEQVTRIPDTSRLYNYFPPAVKTEQEEPTLPDIFSSDCRISSPSNWKSLSTDSPHFQHHDMDKAAYNASLDTAGSFTEGLHPSDSTDAFSHSAAVGSAQGGDASQGISPDADPGTEAHQPPNQGAGDNWNGGGAPLEDLIMQIADTPNPPTHGPLTTAEFLHLALAEGLGGGEYLEGDGEELDDDTESDENDHEMDHADEEEPEEDGQETQDEGSDHSVGSQMDRPPCNLLRCMFRRAFREDHEILKTLIAKQHYSASADPVFPILHFSQTDIRLINSPFANHHTVVCYSPLLQPFTHPIPSVRACDRFNMVQQIPEHGIVVAVSQKGRAAIISLTESDVGFSFRVDWIVPFESQEKYGERPLVPLLGMSVSPIQGFELPPDIPYIPHGEDGFGDLAFRYRVLNHPDYDSPSDHTQESNISSETHLTKDSDQSDQPADTDPDQEQGKKTSPTNAERHAWASRIYRPDEPWRGWNQSRHYRLLLMYADHTVMSYEFWYGSKVAENSGGDSGCEDPYLMI